jgi:hypothetical protein
MGPFDHWSFTTQPVVSGLRSRRAKSTAVSLKSRHSHGHHYSGME